MAAIRKKHILLVEDNVDELDELRHRLQERGFTVDVALNGREALDTLLANPNYEPALVLLDLGMPVMDGWELLAIMRSYYRFRDIPVFLVTGLKIDPDARSVFEGVFTKPVAEEELLQRVEAVCGQAA
jgi:CheY-like chemotaxis protein